MKRIIPGYIIIIAFSSFLLGQMARQNVVRLALEQALKEAVENNDFLQRARSEVNGALAAVEESKGNFLPKIMADFDYTRLDIVPGFKQVVLGNIQNDLFPHVTVTQPLYTGGKFKHTKEMADAALESQRFDLENDQLNIKLAVTLLYYELISINNEIEILQENRRQLETNQQYSRLLVQAGRMSELELNRLEVEIANIDGGLLKARNDYQLTSNNLGVLMGRSEPATFLPMDMLSVEPISINPEDLLKTALENNPVWRKFNWDIKKAESRVQLQKALGLPQVMAIASYGYEFGLESFSFAKNKRYLVGLSAQMPIFDGGVTGARVTQAESQLEQIKWQQEYFRKNLEAQVNNFSLRLDEMKEKIGIHKKAVEQAEKSYRLAQIEYHAGRRSNTDLLDIQKSLLNSRLQLNEAVIEYNNAKAQLLFVLGKI